MPNHPDTKPDPLTDDVGALLRKLNARTGWARDAARLLDELVTLLEQKKYYRFDGHLERFCGKTVRVVCVSSGRFDRSLMAGKMG